MLPGYAGFIQLDVGKICTIGHLPRFISYGSLQTLVIMPV